MTYLNHAQYELIERAVARGTRIAVFRRNREYVVIPLALSTHEGREAIETRHPVSGHPLTIFVDEIERVDALG